MTVDTERQHYECTKCGNLISMNEYQNRGYARNGYAECSKGGKCKWKKHQQAFNKSLLGWLFGLIFKR